MREADGLVYIKEACKKLGQNHKCHMKMYGINNEKRLTGKNETSSIDNFSWEFQIEVKV